LVIVCDSPAFNFHIAKAAKKAGIKTLFYVAPQLWSWAGWRIRKLRKCCDKLCCILPFEQDWFTQRGIDTTFVGNPILDELTPPLASFRKKYLDFRPENAHFAILPGSRSAELKTLWLPMQRIALRLKERYRNAAFTVAAVDADREKQLRMAQILGFRCKYKVGEVSETARAADFAIVASGSATLQVAAAGCPMVIMYQSSKILWYLLSWWLITTKFLSLVNILANKELVPEFMPHFGSIEPIVETIKQLVADKGKLAEISGELVELAEPLTRKKACKEAANIALGMLGAK
jgi:lipid-A-disaccharide synthase